MTKTPNKITYNLIKIEMKTEPFFKIKLKIIIIIKIEIKLTSTEIK